MFMTIVKKSQDLKNVSYHKLYDILKQHQNEVNEIRVERLARTVNPLALVAQQQQQPYDNQRAVNVSGARENVVLPILSESRFSVITARNMGMLSRECSETKTKKEKGDIKEVKLITRKRMDLKHIILHGTNSKRLLPDPVNNSGPIIDDEPCIRLQNNNDNITCLPWKKNVLSKPESINHIYLANKLVEIILFIVDFGCSKHMTGNLKLLTNFVEKFLAMMKFGNDQITPILGYGDLVQGTITIKRVYYVEGLNHNLFSVGHFCDADLEVAFRKSTCYICDLKGNDLLTGSRGTDLYSITLQDSTSPNPICLMAKATSSQAWLWHRRLSYLNFDTINLLSKNNIVNGLSKLKFVKDHLCSSCELGKAKRKSFHTKTTPSSKRRLQILHMDLLFGPDDGIRHETSTARTPEQNSVVERRNHTLVEAASNMLSASKVPLFSGSRFAKASCLLKTQSLVIPRHEKNTNHIINARKPSVKFFHIFGSLCYIVRDGENLDKMKEKGDACIFVGYSTQSKAYRVFNKRTRIIVETIHVNFDELPQMASDHASSDPGPQCSTTILKTGVKKCNFWDWYDDDVENEWYRTHLYEMYRLLNPSQRRQLETEISSQEEVVLLQLEMQTMRDELSKCQKKAFFWKSAVILFVVVWFVSSMN
ncbi:integrase, catalytic region, zinc finger, CCHC-type containing protein [Tanacetum coccineum]|uniref:Integrase, catalytic region, zinc finger, CCHC-type containing protein n=1 Tax=Tanacetum coccineum TaxID=301880 RepID=A0ABQ5DH64_9ASTR